MGKQKKKLIDSHFPIGRQGRYRKQFLPPPGIIQAEPGKPPTVEQMLEAGCVEAEDARHFKERMDRTANNPCNGCPAWHLNGPVCGAFQQFHVAWTRYQRALATQAAENIAAITPHNLPDDHELAGKSMKEIAVALGLSLSKVRTLRREGKLATYKPGEAA